MQYKYKCGIDHQACFIYADVQSVILCYALFCTKVSFYTGQIYESRPNAHTKNQFKDTLDTS